MNKHNGSVVQAMDAPMHPSLALDFIPTPSPRLFASHISVSQPPPSPCTPLSPLARGSLLSSPPSLFFAAPLTRPLLSSTFARTNRPRVLPPHFPRAAPPLLPHPTLLIIRRLLLYPCRRSPPRRGMGRGWCRSLIIHRPACPCPAPAPPRVQGRAHCGESMLWRGGLSQDGSLPMPPGVPSPSYRLHAGLGAGARS